MKRCPITLEEIPEGSRYSRSGLKRLDPRLRDLQLLPYTQEQQLEEAAARADKMSVQGVQPKLSAVLRVGEGRLEVVDRGGRFILKPCPPQWSEVPANEALTMTLAGLAGIEVPVHGLVSATDASWVYFVRRFDRAGQGERLPLEDGAQLLGRTRDTKYDSSLEQVIGMIDRFCTFPVIEKRKFMQRVWFGFLTGNEDMHLKNWSLLARDGRIALSPAYDLLNTSLVLKNTQEESALPIRGRKRHLNRSDLLDYLAVDRCGLPPALMRADLENLLCQAETGWPDWIQRSFLSESKRVAYLHLVRERVARLRRERVD